MSENAHPYEIGVDLVQRYFKVMEGCARREREPGDTANSEAEPR